MLICIAVAFWRWNIPKFYVILFLQTWSWHQMTCEGTAVVWQWRKRQFHHVFPWGLKSFFEFRNTFCHLTNWKFVLHNMASVPVYCLCRLPYDVTRFMIECDICQDWFHGRWVFDGLCWLLRQSCRYMYWSVQPFHVCCVGIFLCSCVGVEEDKATEIDLYHCPNCQVTHGPSVSKSFRSPHPALFMFFITRCLIR